MERFQKNWSFSTENGKENRESYLWIVLHCARYVHLLFAVIANGVKQSQGIATPAFGRLAMTIKVYNSDGSCVIHIAQYDIRNTRYEKYLPSYAYFFEIDRRGAGSPDKTGFTSQSQDIIEHSIGITADHNIFNSAFNLSISK